MALALAMTPPIFLPITGDWRRLSRKGGDPCLIVTR